MIQNILSLLDALPEASDRRNGGLADFLTQGDGQKALSDFADLLDSAFAEQGLRIHPEDLVALRSGKDLPLDGKASQPLRLLAADEGDAGSPLVEENVEAVLQSALGMAGTENDGSAGQSLATGQAGQRLLQAMREALARPGGDGAASLENRDIRLTPNASAPPATIQETLLSLSGREAPDSQRIVLPERLNLLHQALAVGRAEEGGERQPSLDGVLRQADGRGQLVQPASPQQLAALFSTASQSGESSSMNRLPPMQMPVGGQNWNHALGQRVVMMAGQGMDRAEIKLHPPHLGPLEIRMTVTQDQATLTLSSHHAQTRDALEQALPRLREMLQEKGLDLAQADVSDGRERNGEASRQAMLNQNQRSLNGDAATVPDGEAVLELRIGLLDEYA
ncbi:flagellar hook-length control protein FliK [Natronospira bacteriovora]|uniref:Flagellar hook-length control protein FliK n=1 Tax=Natronospira bacteriovora TaxID=3069753 RepID=A0ABU0W385_9GAMM|nr:flagellar hook-length control protein FliK [Natronospira sp. AB-CW4]MDQ2068469.1 flagellar hook-length control protein FliK [Natronospira sp. AB-CW4]